MISKPSLPNISFSSDTNQISRKDLDETSQIAETYFGTQSDPNQIETSPENRDWVYRHLKKYVNIIRYNRKIIGFALMLPTSIAIMNLFTLGKINERELFEKIKLISTREFPQAIYLCSAVINKEFRRKGIVTTGFVKLIKNLNLNATPKPVLFYEAYSKDGDRLAKKNCGFNWFANKT